jgi:hypothetical protein
LPNRSEISISNAGRNLLLGAGSCAGDKEIAAICAR